jgi:hypothetical protein
VTEQGYSAANITVLTMADSVRKRPGMYFGVGRGDPRLATEVLSAVVGHAFHPAAKVAASHSPHVVADITADLTFAVTDDQADTLTGPGAPRLGYEGSLLTGRTTRSRPDRRPQRGADRSESRGRGRLADAVASHARRLADR